MRGKKGGKARDEKEKKTREKRREVKLERNG